MPFVSGEPEGNTSVGELVIGRGMRGCGVGGSRDASAAPWRHSLHTLTSPPRLFSVSHNRSPSLDSIITSGGPTGENPNVKIIHYYLDTLTAGLPGTHEAQKTGSDEPLLDTRSHLPLENKLLIYKTILKPMWTYGLELWGSAKPSNIKIILRKITNASFCLQPHLTQRP